MCPFGYHRSPEKQGVPFEPEAEAVRFMFRRLAAGRSLYGIVDDLNAHGFRPRRAARWTRGSVWSILKNPAYGGAALYRGTRSTQVIRAGPASRIRMGVYSSASHRERRPCEDRP